MSPPKGSPPAAMTPETRVGVLVGLLERVWRNARDPRPAFLEFWDRPVPARPARPRPAQPSVAPEESRAERLSVEDAPPPTAPGREREALLAFGDESTQTGDPVEAERLILLEQEAARQDRVAPAASPTQPSPASLRPITSRPPPVEDDVSLVIDDFDLPGPATVPPAASSAPMIDIEAIENDALDLPESGEDHEFGGGTGAGRSAFGALIEPDPEPFLRADPRATITNEAALERARAESIRPSDRQFPAVAPPAPIEEDVDMESVSPSAPPTPAYPAPAPPVSSLELKDADDVPSSVRKPVTLDRPVDNDFDDFGPVAPPSEPPPESGEVPSQRRLLTPPAFAAATPGESASAVTDDARSSEEAALPRRGAELPRLGDDEDDDDDFAGQTKLFRKSERAFTDDLARVEAEADEAARADDSDLVDEDEDDEVVQVEEGEYEATKEIRTMGRVDVVERQPLAAGDVILLSEPRQKTPSTFGELLDLALSIGS
ncbi:MAG: hypothetical protein U0414_08365 [Polyangiaceae bacterium]